MIGVYDQNIHCNKFPIHFAAGPNQVTNVHVHVYEPVLYSDVITALIVWDLLSPIQAGGIVNRYIVHISEIVSGAEIAVSKPLHAHHIG